MQSQKSGTKKINLSIIIAMITPGAVLLSALMPAVLGVFLALEEGGGSNAWAIPILLAIPCLGNAGVDLLNDYYDYIGGNDTPENIVLEAEGPLAYHRIKDARPALWLGWVCILAAVALGVYVVVCLSWKPLLIGMIGAIVAVTYSGNRISTSHIPIGEPLAGFVLGGLVPFAVTTALTDHFDWWVLVKAIPMMLIVSEFMLDNNTCDIVRDQIAGRRTLPIVIGREKAQKLANAMTVIWMGVIFLNLTIWYPIGLPLMAAAIFLCRKGLVGTFRIVRRRETKIEATEALSEVAFWVGMGYPASVLLHLAVTQWLK